MISNHTEDAIYLGCFSKDELTPVLDAAAPIARDNLEEEDLTLGQGKKRPMPRSEALVRRLEVLRGMAEINLLSRRNPPSVHAKTMHAISASAAKLLQKLGAGERGECHEIPLQIWRSLRSAAEADAESTRGFHNRPPIKRSIQGHEFFDYGSDDQLREDIGAIARIAAWSARAEKKERTRIGRHNVGMWLAASDNEPPWTGDPINDVLSGAIGIWTEVLGRDFATSVGADGIAAGPLVRFSLACLQLLGVREMGRGKPVERDAVRKRLRDIHTSLRTKRPVRKGRRKRARLRLHEKI